MKSDDKDDIADIDSGEEDAKESFPHDLGDAADRETVAYVVGANIHRLGCPDCKTAMVNPDAPVASSFTAFMTYSSASMLNPKENVVDYFCTRLKPILAYYEKNFYMKNIVKSTCMKFRFKNDFPACSQFHANAFLMYFARMLLRNFCKEKNLKLESASKTRKKFSKLNV